jgi:AAA domain, putative AbiEii toxin, Type IV TA system/AAA domain
MYVKTITVSNLRCFDRAALKLNYPNGDPQADSFPNVNLILGENGAGKTTVLKALALGVLSPVIQNSGYVPYYLVRRCKERHGVPEPGAWIRSDLVLHEADSSSEHPADKEEIRTDIEVRGSLETIAGPSRDPHLARIYDEASPAFFVVGYGATRRVESAESVEIVSRKRRALRYQRVAGLFEEYIGLTPLASWLPALNSKSRAKEIISLINSLLPGGTRFTGVLDPDREPLFTQRGVELPQGALSDGYRAFTGLVGDLIYHLHTVCPPGQKRKLTDLPGLVLVDDVDLHLHPSWQREVVPKLARAFPRLQFVLTTHSPIVVGTLRPENIFLTEADGDGPSVVRQIKEPVYGLNADQVLTSSYFGLDSTRAEGAERNLKRLARQAENGDPEAAVRFLQALSRKRPAE